ncbi:polyprotein [Persimmon ampelovirus]|nr:polyprotein [Persimmon ampelovirus]
MKKQRPSLGNKRYLERDSKVKREVASAFSKKVPSLEASTLRYRYDPPVLSNHSKDIVADFSKPDWGLYMKRSDLAHRYIWENNDKSFPINSNKATPSRLFSKQGSSAQSSATPALSRPRTTRLFPNGNAASSSVSPRQNGHKNRASFPSGMKNTHISSSDKKNKGKNVFVPKADKVKSVSSRSNASSSSPSKASVPSETPNLLDQQVYALSQLVASGDSDSFDGEYLDDCSGKPCYLFDDYLSDEGKSITFGTFSPVPLLERTYTTVKPDNSSKIVSVYRSVGDSDHLSLAERRHVCGCSMPIVVRHLDSVDLPTFVFKDKLKNRRAVFYSRDKSSYKYPGGFHKSRGWSPKLDGLLLDMGFLPEEFDHCLCQIYELGGAIPPHADNEECYGEDVKVLTLNAIGEASFTLGCDKGNLIFNIGQGDYFLMPAGCQTSHKHAVTANTSGRISLTFRNSKNLKVSVASSSEDLKVDSPAEASSSNTCCTEPLNLPAPKVSSTIGRTQLPGKNQANRVFPNSRSPSGITYFRDGRDVCKALNEKATVFVPLREERLANKDYTKRPNISIPVIQFFVEDCVYRNTLGTFGKKFFVLDEAFIVCVVDHTLKYTCSIPENVWFCGLRAGEVVFRWMKHADGRMVYLPKGLQFPTLREVVQADPSHRLVGHENVTFMDSFYKGVTLGRRGFCWVNPVLDSGFDVSFLPNASHVPVSFVLKHVKEPRFVKRGKFLHMDPLGKVHEGGKNVPVGAAEVEPSFDLSKVESLGSDHVLNKVLDTIASRPVFKEGSSVMVTLDNILSNYINNTLKLRQSTHIVLSQYLTDEERDLLAKFFGGVHMEFKQQWRGSHSFLNSMRAVLNHMIHMEYHCFKISSIGGSFGGHLLYGPSDVHICCPLMETRDGQRFWKSFHDSFSAVHHLRKTDVIDAKRFMRSLTNSVCYKGCGECDVPSTVITLVDVYDISLQSLVAAMEKKGAVLAKVAFIFCPELMLMEGSFSYPGAGVTVSRSGDRLTYMIGDSGETYIHSLNVLSSYVRSERVMSKSRLLYAVELSGCYGPYILLTVSVTSDVMSKPTTARVFPAWTANKSVVRYLKFDGQKHNIRSIYVDRDFATRMLLYMSNVAASFEDRTLEYAISALRSHKTTMVVGSRLIHSKIDLPNDSVVEIAASFTREAVKRRHLNRKSLSCGSFWGLLKNWISRPFRYLKEVVRDFLGRFGLLQEWFQIRDLTSGSISYVEDLPDSIYLELQSCTDDFCRLNVAAVCEVMNFSRAALIEKLEHDIVHAEVDTQENDTDVSKSVKHQPKLLGGASDHWFNFLLSKGDPEDLDRFWMKLWRFLRKVSRFMTSLVKSFSWGSCWRAAKNVVTFCMTMMSSCLGLLSLKKKVTKEVKKNKLEVSFGKLGSLFEGLANNCVSLRDQVTRACDSQPLLKLGKNIVATSFGKISSKFTSYFSFVAKAKNDFARMAKSYGVDDFDSWIIRKKSESMRRYLKDIFLNVVNTKFAFVPVTLLIAVPALNYAWNNKEVLMNFGSRVHIMGVQCVSLAFKAKYLLTGFMMNQCCDIPLVGLAGFLRKSPVLEGMVLSKLAKSAFSCKLSMSLLLQLLAVLPLSYTYEIFSDLQCDPPSGGKNVDLNVNISSMDGDKEYVTMIKRIRDGLENRVVSKSDNVDDVGKESTGQKKITPISNADVPDFIPDVTKPVKGIVIKAGEGTSGTKDDTKDEKSGGEISASDNKVPLDKGKSILIDPRPVSPEGEKKQQEALVKNIAAFVSSDSTAPHTVVETNVPPVSSVNIEEIPRENVVQPSVGRLTTSSVPKEIGSPDLSPTRPVHTIDDKPFTKDQDDIISSFLNMDEPIVGASSSVCEIVSDQSDEEDASSFSSGEIFYADTFTSVPRTTKLYVTDLLVKSGLTCMLASNMLEEIRKSVTFTRKVDVPTDKEVILEWLAYEARDLWGVLDVVRNIEVGGFVGKGAKCKTFSLRNLSTNIAVTCYVSASELDILLEQDDSLRQRKLIYCFGSGLMKDNLATLSPADFPCFDLACDTPCYGYMKLMAVREHLEEVLHRRHVDFPIEYVNAVPGAGKTYAILKRIENTVRPLIVLSSTRANKIEIASKVPKHLNKIVRVRTVDSALINFDDSRTFTKCEMLIDECYLPHVGQLQAIFSLYQPTKVTMYGDRHQIPFIPRTEGFICTKAEHDINKENYTEILRTYRCPADICYWLNHVAKRPDTVYSGLVTTFNKTLRSVVRVASSVLPVQFFKEVSAILTFTQADKEMAWKMYKGSGIKRKDTLHISTIHEAQGKTFENVVIFRGRQAEDEVYKSLPHRLVGLTRHTRSLKYVVHPSRTSDALSKDIDLIISAKDYVLSSFMIEQCS